MMAGRRPRFRGVRESVLLLVAAAGMAANTRWHSPPRFDGAGYAVLARSLASGQGYREIDHPDRPPHAHFPPGYPLALATWWRLTGVSAESAHVLSAGCTLGAIGLLARWFRKGRTPRTAWLLALALACNWRWQREGAAIQSEPLFHLLTALALLATEHALRRGRIRDGAVLGLVLGASCLTRHIGVGLSAACLLTLALRCHRAAAAALLGSAVLIAPWAVWLARVGQGTQIALIPRGGFLDLIAHQALFYLRRLPDQITGPFVEVATVFRPALAAPATAWSVLATAVIAGGWVIGLRSARGRLAALVPLATLPILLVWPFTEAGRFLGPLIPFVLVGAQRGLAGLGRGVGWPRLRRWPAAALVLASMPYSLYSASAHRAGAQADQHADFDAACRWIANEGLQPGPVLSRHPGEVFWQTGRPALGIVSADPAAIDRLIERYGVAYLLIDEERYARAPTNPLKRYVKLRPQRVAAAWRGSTARVYAIERPP